MAAKRIVRYLCLNRSSLRRRCDVIEAWLTVAFLAMLVPGPFVARHVGNAVYQNQLSRTDAVVHDPFLAEPVPAGTGIVHGVADPSARAVWAMWDGAVAGVVAMLSFTAVVLGLWWVARRWFDRRRAAAWEAAWVLVAQEWSGRK